MKNLTPIEITTLKRFYKMAEYMNHLLMQGYQPDMINWDKVLTLIAPEAYDTEIINLFRNYGTVTSFRDFKGLYELVAMSYPLTLLLESVQSVHPATTTSVTAVTTNPVKRTYNRIKELILANKRKKALGRKFIAAVEYARQTGGKYTGIIAAGIIPFLDDLLLDDLLELKRLTFNPFFLADCYTASALLWKKLSDKVTRIVANYQ